ncbi:unnamed protein product [Vitrella brassicaformis CCMP3155]|uniref:Uncharacterized protein n=1 Tax=Vitrella brassicaformis (strain CCMP3155) TaxID=1169540 RepID=A0A0G4EGN4_VITBC|nr:unnamed protein product [Vitrella brassicaformis CCMP3155]|eukprot:CEL95609.1 unnamed protein product [Vitrella brassicaformis CCMP3155]
MLFLLCSVVVLLTTSATFDSPPQADVPSDFIAPATNATAEDTYPCWGHPSGGLVSGPCEERDCKVRFLFELHRYWVRDDPQPRVYDPPRVMDIAFNSKSRRLTCHHHTRDEARKHASQGAEKCIAAIRDTFYTEAFDGWDDPFSACGLTCMDPPQFMPEESGSFAQAIGRQVCGWFPDLPPGGPATHFAGYVIASIEGDRCCFHSDICCPAREQYGFRQCRGAMVITPWPGRMEVSPGMMRWSCNTGGPL